MKVLHMESGLGNQMLGYCDYLAVKKANPDENCYIETIIFDIPECNEVIRQWNGYELPNIFGIHLPNIQQLFNNEEWHDIMEEIRAYEFWNKSWNYPPCFTHVLRKHGLNLKNRFGDFEEAEQSSEMKKRVSQIVAMPIVQAAKRAIAHVRPMTVAQSRSFDVSCEDTFEGHTLSYMYRGAGIEMIDKEVREAFSFPDFIDEKNKAAADAINKVSAVSVHLRRGDGLEMNRRYFDRGYYRKAVQYMRKKVKDPVFYVFSSPGDIQWARTHLAELGLEGAEVRYVDWNSGAQSFRDMQLMAMCKHNIISFSSFSWFGSYLNPHADKITISPEPKILTTNWM